MKTLRTTWLVILVLGCGFLAVTQSAVFAQDADALAKQARSAIKASQRAMFSRKFDDAQKQLATAADLLEQLKAADPDYPQLSTLENQFQKQQKDLEKRLPKEEPAEPTPEAAASSEDGPDLKTLARQAGNAISASQRAMMNRKFDEAQAELAKAAELIAHIKAADADFSQLNGLESHYERQKADLEKRLPKDETAAAPAADAPPAATEDGPAKLPGTVLHYLEQVDQTLERQERIFEKKELVGDPDSYIGNLESALKQVNETMERIFDSYGDQFDHEHPDVKARQAKIAEFQANIAELQATFEARQAQAADAEARQQAQSDEWLQKIGPYVAGPGQPGHDEGTYLIGAGTANVDELVARKQIYGTAKEVFDEYQQVEFPDGKTQALEMAADELALALEGFESGYQESLDRFASDIEEQLAYTEQWLTQQEASAAEAEKPLLLSSFMLQQIQRPLFALEAATSGEDARLPGFNERLAAIEERGTNLRRLGVKRTVMFPDAFGGAEIEALKASAAEFLHAEYPDAEVLRTTIISEAWTENRQWEYTDTTKTAIRYRITRSVTAQIAGKTGDEVSLYTLDISQDQQSDGSWGPSYGHVMFSDPMLEENVNK